MLTCDISPATPRRDAGGHQGFGERRGGAAAAAKLAAAGGARRRPGEDGVDVYSGSYDR